MKHKKAKAALTGAALSKTPLPLRVYYTPPNGICQGVFESFFINLAKIIFFPINPLTICKFYAIILANEQRRSLDAARAVHP